jgi:hypothetical protein
LVDITDEDEGLMTTEEYEVSWELPDPSVGNMLICQGIRRRSSSCLRAFCPDDITYTCGKGPRSKHLFTISSDFTMMHLYKQFKTSLSPY